MSTFIGWRVSNSFSIPILGGSGGLIFLAVGFGGAVGGVFTGGGGVVLAVAGAFTFCFCAKLIPTVNATSVVNNNFFMIKCFKIIIKITN